MFVGFIAEPVGGDNWCGDRVNKQQHRFTASSSRTGSTVYAVHTTASEWGVRGPDNSKARVKPP